MKLTNFVLLSLSILISSCNKKSDDSDSNPLSPGGANDNSSVNIEIIHQESQEYYNVVEFWFKPHSNIRVEKVAVKVSNFEDTLDGNLDTVYEKDRWYLLSGYEGVELGQVWSFTFHGKIDPSDQGFQKTISYTVQ